MGRPQLPAALIRSKEIFMAERQVIDFLRAQSAKHGIDRRKLVEDILVAWCKRNGLKPVTLPPKPPRKVTASVS